MPGLTPMKRQIRFGATLSVRRFWMWAYLLGGAYPEGECLGFFRTGEEDEAGFPSGASRFMGNRDGDSLFKMEEARVTRLTGDGVIGA